MKTYKFITYSLLFTLLTVVSCREIELVVPSEYVPLPFDIDWEATPAGMYLLNEANMGSNKSLITWTSGTHIMYATFMPNATRQ